MRLGSTFRRVGLRFDLKVFVREPMPIFLAGICVVSEAKVRLYGLSKPTDRWLGCVVFRLERYGGEVMHAGGCGDDRVDQA